jgi:hypothetical protein
MPQVFIVDHHDIAVEISRKDRRDGKRFAWGPGAGYRKHHPNMADLLRGNNFAENGSALPLP